MSKKIIISMPDGSAWSVDPQLVAENRAAYYAETLNFERGSVMWHEEVQYLLDDNTQLKEWLLGDMSWGELCAKPIKLPSYERLLYEAEIYVVEESHDPSMDD